MHWARAFAESTIGKKIFMAASGVILVGFVLVHMTGNLLMFQGPAAINHYSAFLKSSAPLLWAVRITLLVSVAVHIGSAWSLTLVARAARPARYARHHAQVSTWGARSMRTGGVLLFGFIVFHLLHLTTGNVHPEFSPSDVYGNVVVGLRMPVVAAFYVVAMIALGLHLAHGVSSLFQTLGLNHPHWNPIRHRLAIVLAVLVFTGFSTIPLAVAFGVLR